MISSWQLQPIFGSYLLVAVLAGILLLLLFISPGFGSLTSKRKRWLVILRSIIALLLAVGMLRPALVRTDRQTQQALVLVLFDNSRSMTYRDGADGKTRWDQQMDIVTRAIPKLEALGEHFEVELVAFSGDIEPQPIVNSKLRVSAKPDGAATDLGLAISEALQRHVGKRLAAVVLLSDGAQRSLSSETPPLQAARQLDRRAAPLYTIALGQSRDQSQARDVSIASLQDEYSVFVKNEFALRVGVRIQGYVNRPIPVSLTVEDPSGQRERVGVRDLVATEDSQTVIVDFAYRAEEAGQYRLFVEADPQEGELVENNKATAFLRVRDGGLRVLLISSGALDHERKFIERSLNQSQEIELDYQPISVKSRAAWPIDVETLGDDLANYDVFIVGGVDARALKAENWQKMSNLVEAGRGFMMYGGFHSFGPGNFADSAISDLLPLQLSRTEREVDPTKQTRFDRQIAGELQVIPKGDSSITHLAPEESNASAWAELKPIFGANKFDNLKDQAIVIAETQNGDPLLVQSQFVAGRVLASAMDSTYRWWRYGRADAHKRFWRQSVLWLARRDKQEANSIFIDLPQRRFMAGTRIAFTCGLTDEAGDSIPDASLNAVLAGPDGQSWAIDLAATADSVQGTIPKEAANEAGIYRIEIKAEGTAAPTSSYADFVVIKEDFELSDPAANPGLLDMLAKRTVRVGGKAIAPEQLPTLIDEIKASPPKSEVELQTKWQLGDTAIDAWMAFGLLVLLLSFEWFLRKSWGLV